jgi:fructose-1,6-bisphosphatase I
MTLSRFILTEQKKHPMASGDLSILLNGIQIACKAISAIVRRAALKNVLGLSDGSNASGDSQKKLDVIANDIFTSAIRNTGQACLLISEEEEVPVYFESSLDAKYIVLTDPLDGSSVISSNGLVGSIFSIVKRRSPTSERPNSADYLHSNLLISGYCIYGGATELVLAGFGPLQFFSLDPTIGEFILSRGDMKIPADPERIYSVNEGNVNSFPVGVKDYLNALKEGAKPYSMRYCGSMIGDIHRTIINGGVFLYPPTHTNKNGKLRILYEGFPMAMVIESAGGLAVAGPSESHPSGGARILDIVATSIHQRSPIYLGCKRDIEALLQFLNKKN